VPAGISLASGCVSGFLTATATFPLDVIRRRMQVYGRQHQGEPVSYSRIIRQITSQGHGLRGFYVGILPEYCKVVPGVAIAFCTYEQLKQWMRVQQ
jgi:solute carrier family 25 phosphate transporter 23/24/25/41